MAKADRAKILELRRAVEMMMHGKALKRVSFDLDLIRKTANLALAYDDIKARVDELEKIVADHEKDLIFGFYEEEYPKYSQGPQKSEIQELATAAEVNILVKMLNDMTEKCNKLRTDKGKRKNVWPFS